MRAIQVTRHGGPDVLSYGTVDDPIPAADEVLVRVTAVGVNFIDTYLRRGLYPSQPPYVPGTEGAGEIVAVGSEVSDLGVGTRVCWCDAPASYGELVAVRAARAVPIPDGVSDEVAGSSLLRGLTAHYLLDGSAHPAEGDAILLHAGAGGVGLILTQLAKRKGLRVITTVSSDEKAELSAAAGADHVLRYGDDLVEQVRGLTDGAGVRVTYDGVGADTFDQSVASTGIRGFVVLFGAASGPVPPFDLQRLNSAGSLSVTRPTLAHFIADPDELAWRASEYLGALADGVEVRVGQRYRLADAEQAHADLEGRRTTGTSVLVPN
ncbi:quinone oxidoreductase Qor [Gordonia polyisoprenivorans VH2]|uniref:Quinone oxidoreductase Qor n=2 Tax=Gordonia polyisoprenivorans TaxID=84595 RepID=H6N1J8_GORPV|nr:quinone oxidoreductase [Gordonia polyisoprenivorans]AFA73317.1 quinone oxidoreductase Qor [Gordonia polyisoprenivorans VH2]NKY02285.1 quinone oxidoreductase [Gordonia polyisoprenivorans]QUD85183.1 quinone oxidoreductase [Gordonia polyisoprenivorans]WCB39708.1 quinone oxidoreductase [Gordonia polyisoprenivorans]GAB23660.1 NADPH--quinone reductase [Gordonia polyisoprenivorans NBRC 16320 = JCM 10675]